MFKTPFSFKGRIRRTEYGISAIIHTIFVLLGRVLLISESDAADILYILLLIPSSWMVYAQGAKRCHDIGKSGWWQILPFFVFVMLFRDGDEGLNEYGSNPKSDTAKDIIDSIGKE